MLHLQANTSGLYTGLDDDVSAHTADFFRGAVPAGRQICRASPSAGVYKWEWPYSNAASGTRGAAFHTDF